MEDLSANFNPRYTDDRYRYTLTHLKSKVSRDLQKLTVDHKTVVKRKQSVIVRLETENECKNNDIVSLNKEVTYLKENLRFSQDAMKQHKTEKEEWRKKCEHVTTDFTQVVNHLKRLGVLSPKSLRELTTDGKKLKLAHVELRLKGYTEEKKLIERFLAKHKKDDKGSHAEIVDNVRAYEMGLELLNEQISVVKEIFNSKASDLDMNDSGKGGSDSEFIRQRFCFGIDKEFEALRDKTMHLQSDKLGAKKGKELSKTDKTEIEKLQLKILDLEKEKENNNTSLRALRNGNEDTKSTELLAAAKENESLKKKLAKTEEGQKLLDKALNESKEEINHLKTKLLELQKHIDELTQSNKELENSRAEHEKVSKELKTLLKRERETTKIIPSETKATEQNKENVVKQEVKISKAKALSKINSKLSVKAIDEETNSERDLKQRLSVLQNDFEKSQAKVKSLENDIIQLQAKIEDMQKENETLKKVEVENVDTSSVEIDPEKVKTKETEIKRLENLVRNSKVNQASLEKEVVTANNTISVMQKEIDDFKNKLSEIQSKSQNDKDLIGSERDAAKELQNRVNVLEHELKISEGTIGDLRNKMESLHSFESKSTQLEIDCKQLKEDIGQRNLVMKEKDESITALNKKTKTLTTEIKKLKEQLSNDKENAEKVDKITKNVEKYEKEVITLTDSNKTLTKELTLSKSKAKANTKAVDKLKEQIDTLEKAKIELIDKNRLLEDQIEKLKSKMEATGELTTSIDEEAKVSGQVSAKEKEIEALRAAKLELESKMGSKNGEQSDSETKSKELIAKQEHEIKLLIEQNKSLNDELGNVQKELEQVSGNADKQNLKKLKNEILKTRNTVDVLSKEKTSIENKFKEAQEVENKITEELQEKINNLTRKEDENAKQIKDFKEQNLKLKLMFKTVKTQLDSSKKDASDEKAKHLLTNEKLKDTMVKLETVEEEILKLKEDKKELTKVNGQIQSSVDELTREKSRLEKTTKDLNEKLRNDKLVNENKQLAEENTRIRSELKTMGTGDDMKQKYGVLVEETQKHQRNIENLTKQLSDNEARFADMDAKMEKAKEMYQKHKETIRKQETQLTILTQEKQALERKIAILKDRSSLGQQLEEAEEQKKKLTQEVAKCKAIINVMKVKGAFGKTGSAKSGEDGKDTVGAAALLFKRKKSTVQ